ncbi:MAG: aminopeptidase P N-terminal domain-containing protein [Flavobacteriales bacterium]|nr:aminopeptidase P N-terminal domain-containing protein [Flavobacteriales bacterium]
MTLHITLPFLFLLSTLAQAQEMPEPVRIADEQHGIYDNDLLSPEFHRGRREALREKLPKGGVAVFFASPVRNRSNDVDYEYHQDPNFYYLSGLTEPEALLFVFKEPHMMDGQTTTELLVVQDRDPKTEVWNGKSTGPQEAREVLGLDHTMSAARFKNIEFRLKETDGIYIHRTDDPENDPHSTADLADLLEHLGTLLPPADSKKVDGPADIRRWMAELRELKQGEELALMRKAIDITCEAQKELMHKLEPNMTEYQTEAIVEYVFKANGAEHEGFPSIQGGGPHSCVLHYITNRRTLADGDLLVSDIGAEYHGYTADVTRTLPANGKFTADQRAIYDLVLAAQEAGIAEVKAGKAFRAPHNAAWNVIVKGMKDLGIIKEESELRRYFMHGTSHYLGLDVHDAGTYGELKAGSVITVEPGIYIAKDSPCDPRWWGIGVRIEDDILVTEGDPVNLSAGAPRKADEVEALMAK